MRPGRRSMRSALYYRNIHGTRTLVVKGASRHSSSVWPTARRRTRLVDYPSHPAGLCSADLLCASSAVNHRLQQARHHGELQLLRSQVRFELCPAHDVGARRAHRTTCQCASPSALATVSRTTSTENVAPTLVWRRRALGTQRVGAHEGFITNAPALRGGVSSEKDVAAQLEAAVSVSRGPRTQLDRVAPCTQGAGRCAPRPAYAGEKDVRVRPPSASLPPDWCLFAP
ncbi:hypothetical protein PHLGIDRAFT_393685 [Phlebiopsis gigantea 11061_1 CR5-6]|uniref:Uncharacterized protein n=1 Tax=Phlebiopsis gigantea (strain 11061_1 CR5-6) TaxID=745531 RepID=A0A0C3PMV5_PHLG1|nr:hypothetical protein PHLGIDRAFT_393685 [Phlebiopsis gigantea 11061_1 CR5-6]